MSEPSQPPQRPSRLAIIGGGITGLAAAWEARRRWPDTEVVVFEASGRLGGVLGSECRDGYLIERSADMFTTREPWALELCREVGIEDELIGPNQQHRRALVVRNGKLYPVPDGFTLMTPTRALPLLASPLLSWRGKLRMLAERFVPQRRDATDESLASFARRRFGEEAHQRLIQPLIGGIYTADPERLSMDATLAQFVNMERTYGSVIRGALRARKNSPTDAKAAGARYGAFLTPREGMGRLITALVAGLDNVEFRLQSPVEQIHAANPGWMVSVRGDKARPANATHTDSTSTDFKATGDKKTGDRFDAVVLAVAAYRGAELLTSVDAELASELSAIDYASAAVVVAGFDRDRIAHPLDAFGVVVPAMENRSIIATSFSSVKFAGRAPDGQVLLRTFVGGALQPELLERDDADIQRLVLDELRALLRVEGAPRWIETHRWMRATPQYHVGHLDRVGRIEQQCARHPGLALAGSAYRGVGIPYCVRSGREAIDRLG